MERAAALWKHLDLGLGIRGIDAQHAWLVALVLELEWVLHHNPQAVPERFHQVVQQEMDIIRLPMELIMVVMDITFGDGEHKNVLYQQFHMEESLEYLVLLVIPIKQ